MSLRSRRWFPLAVAFIALILFVDHVLISRAAPTQQVWINEFMPRPNTGGKEWVELFNPNPIAVDLTGWKIDDDTIGGTQIAISPGAILPANGLLLITSTLATGIFNDTGTDAAQLLDASGGIVDSHTYSTATAGQSFARIPDGSATWVKGLASPGTWNVGVPPSPVPTYTPIPTS